MIADFLPNTSLNLKYFDHLIGYAYPDASQEFIQSLRVSVQDGTWANMGGILEKAISTKGKIPRRDTVGMDFHDQSDAKITTAHVNHQKKTYEARVNKVHAKQGHLRVMCYERMKDTFYYFLIPNSAYAGLTKSSSITIPFNPDGSPRRINRCSVNWWAFECDEFEHMCAPVTN